MKLSIIHQLIKLAKTDPDRPALIYNQKIIVYRDLLASVEMLAMKLSKKKISQGSIVASINTHSIEHLITMLAVASIGAIIIPINPKFSIKVTQTILSKYNAKFIITNQKIKKISSYKLPVVLFQQTDSVTYKTRFQLRLPKPKDPFIIAIPLLLSMPKQVQLNPKAILYTHQYMVKRMERTLDKFTDTIRLIPPDLNFTMGYITSLGTLYLGSTLILTKSNEPQAIYNGIHIHGATHVFISAKVIEVMMSLAPNSSKKIFSSLKHLRILEGQPNKNLVKKLLTNFSSNLYASYGSAETGGLTLATPEILMKSHHSSGKPRAWVTLEIINAAGKKASPYEVGYIKAKGELVPKSYYEDPLISNKKFKNGWFYTEDQGFLDCNGELFLSH